MVMNDRVVMEELVSLDELVIGPELHRSNENVCFMGKFRNQSVVIKRLILNRVDSLDKFEDEVKILTEPKLHNVVKPIAVVRAAPHYSIVLPFLENGSVNNILERSQLPIELILCFALDTAASLESIHDAGYIHRDIKAANVLIGSNWRAWVTDFGSTRSVNRKQQDVVDAMQPSGGFHKRNIDGTTLGYTAPEILRNQEATQAADVYALGMTLAELLTGTPPYHGMEKEDPDLHTVMDSSYSEHALIKAIVNDHLRPGLVTVSEKAGMPMELISLIREMWHDQIPVRPTASACVERLTKLAVKLGVDCSSDSARASYARSIQEVRSDSVDQNEVLLGSTPTACHDVPVVPIHMELDDDSDLGNKVKFNPDIPVGAFATSGRRGADKMEDAHSVGHYSLGSSVLSVYTIFDGHGGKACSYYSNQVLGGKVASALASNPFPTQEVRNQRITEAFVSTDLEFRSKVQDKSGCTAMAVALWKPAPETIRVIVANAGDCRAVLCRNVNGVDQAIRLSNDHNASSPTEQDRIRSHGASIQMTRDGKYRVQGHIQVTRALGDTAFKKFGVCAEPEILEYDLSPSNGDDFIIFATDGVWDTLSDLDAVNAVRNTAKETGLSAKRIGGDALNLGSTDNITVIVCYLKNFDQHADVVFV